MDREQLEKLGKWVTIITSLATLITLIVSAFLSPLRVEFPTGAYVFLGIAAVLALLVWWRIRSIPPQHEIWGILLKGTILLLIFVTAAGLGYWLWRVLQPRFEIVAFSALGGIAFVLALLAWWRFMRPLRLGQVIWKVLIEGIMLLLIIVAAIRVGYWYWQATQQASQPQFEITALDTLDGDENAYELTDQLMWGRNRLGEYGVGITFTLEIRPIYSGNQKFGQVIALISGDSGNPPLEKPLWSAFTRDSDTTQIYLTLPELLSASGLKVNSTSSSNLFRPGDPFFQQARLIVQVARAAAPAHPWASEEITVRNAPWEVRSVLVSRNGQREADVYVRNLGGTGKFTVRYRLVQLKKEPDLSALPEVSGVTTIKFWNEPQQLVYLKKGEFFTDTVQVSNQLAQDYRYLLEIYVVKKQNYVQFEDPDTTWENLNSMNSPWWFGEYPTDKHVFVVPIPEPPVDPTIQAERERLQAEQGVDLGLPLGPAEQVTSATGTVGLRQVFRGGEIYVREGQAYALYGPILEHYRELGGVGFGNLGFPISSIQAVTSSLGAAGDMMEFEGQGPPQPPTVIYASRKGTATVQGWIGEVYALQNGGHSGWLGFPLADPQVYTDSSVQMFEQGYIVRYYPYVDGERDWDRSPVAYPYLASRGTLFDVQAQQSWQDTGVRVQPGDRVTIVQVGGAWTHYGPSGNLYDANGYADLGLQANTTLSSTLTGALIGRIGEDNSRMFLVGRWGVMTSPAEGSLYLAMNDDHYGDNAGLITVEIIVEHPD